MSLDFVNTLDDRYTQPKELLTSYVDLVRFGEDAGVLDPGRADTLMERGAVAVERAHEALLQARELRESIHDVFYAILHKQPVPAEALGRLNAAAQSAAAYMRLVPGKTHFEWRFEDFGDYAAMLWPIARAAADLLTSDQLPYVRACSSKTCEWMFLDTSKNHQRRWCDMTSCGNRAKVKRFYVRTKKGNA